MGDPNVAEKGLNLLLRRTSSAQLAALEEVVDAEWELRELHALAEAEQDRKT